MNDSLSVELKDLIISLLQFDPRERISIKGIRGSDWIRKNKNEGSEAISKKKMSFQKNSRDQKWDFVRGSSVSKIEKKRNHRKHKTLEEEGIYNMEANIVKNKIDINMLGLGDSKENMNRTNFDYSWKRNMKNMKGHLKTESNEALSKKLDKFFHFGEKEKKGEKDVKRKKLSYKKN